MSLLLRTLFWQYFDSIFGARCSNFPILCGRAFSISSSHCLKPQDGPASVFLHRFLIRASRLLVVRHYITDTRRCIQQESRRIEKRSFSSLESLFNVLIKLLWRKTCFYCLSTSQLVVLIYNHVGNRVNQRYQRFERYGNEGAGQHEARR